MDLPALVDLVLKNGSVAVEFALALACLLLKVLAGDSKFSDRVIDSFQPSLCTLDIVALFL